jgi:hypothetical protein
MPEMSSCLNLAKTVKQASAELLFVQFAAGCTNVGVTPTRAFPSEKSMLFFHIL